MLLAASTATVLATANTPPHITSLTVSQSVIDEGQTVTLSGAFTDPDAGDLHTVRIGWGDDAITGFKQQVQLPAGQFSFQVTHTYTDDLAPTSIKVSVLDRQLPPGTNDNSGGHGTDFGFVPIQVKNVAPRFVANSVTVAKGPNRSVAVDGAFVDPGTVDTEQVTANWSDPFAPGTTPCTLGKGERQFHCEHTYRTALVPRTYRITLVARDDDGGTGTFQTSVQIP
jgi:hypothetical protein